MARATQLAADTGVASRQAFMKQYMLGEFNIGISATTEWLNNTRDTNGCRWRWSAFYLAGGAHSGWDKVFYDPWNRWVNPDSVPGVYGRQQIQEALKNRYIPWITTYNLSQSKPAEYLPNPPAAVATNIMVASTMKAYFEQFKILMKICAGFADTPIVVHLEPDEMGHMLLTVNRTDLDPTAVTVKVGSCGMTEISDLPDNVVGYAKAIKRLRDTYAPRNVLLCVSPSPWDWEGRMSARNWYNMFVACGITSWDLAVCETGSSDLGGSGEQPPYANTTGMAGGLDNVITWATQLSALSGLPFVLWQVPMGNTYFKTCNNTSGHYTHNSAQLLLENYPANNRIKRFADGGGIGIIFSPGQWNSTNVYDKMKDGVTNPALIAGNLGNQSSYADDDGGYIRLRSSVYFRNPVYMGTPTLLQGSPMTVAGPDPQAAAIYTLHGRILDRQAWAVVRCRTTSAAGVFIVARGNQHLTYQMNDPFRIFFRQAVQVHH